MNLTVTQPLHVLRCLNCINGYFLELAIPRGQVTTVFSLLF